jgi:rfaE bifunctional protein kinase chain/domain
MQKPDIERIFADFEGIPVAVIGDLMLDTYVWGQVDRISPEAPVPVLRVQRTDHRIGGAGNVALNLAALGASVSIVGVVGQDPEGGLLTGMLDRCGISTGTLIASPSRRTTNKTRVMGRNQQMIRLDSEMTEELNGDDEKRLIAAFDGMLANLAPRIAVFEDYDKGVLTPGFIGHALASCRQGGILTAVDPKRRNFFAYRGVDIFKPNLKEVREALNATDGAVDDDSLRDMHDRLHERLRHSISLITLSERGVFHASAAGSGTIPSHRRDISDVSGAGDTVIAVAALVYAVTSDVELSAAIANIAGGLVCEEVGTVAIDRERLLQECRQLLA